MLENNKSKTILLRKTENRKTDNVTLVDSDRLENNPFGCINKKNSV